MIQKIKTFILSHKIISGIALVVIVAGSYFIFRNNASGETRYITEIVKKGNITTTVTGTGQVEALNSINLKSKTTGDITYVGVKAGQTVKKGALIANVDSRDAKIALENAKISLEKLINPNSLTLLQKQNSLEKSYKDGWNEVSSFITSMTTTMDEIEAIYSTGGFLSSSNTVNMGTTVKNKLAVAEDSLYQAEKSFDNVVKTFNSLSGSSSNEDIKELIIEAYDSAKLISNYVKNTESVFNYIINSLDNVSSSDISTNRTNISSWVSDTNSYVNSLLSAENSIKEDAVSLSNDLDIRSAQLSVQNKQDAYNDCFVTAPFDGVVATLTAKVGESSGSSIGTLITEQKIATISLNEVDIARIKLGQKATLTFDAVEDLNIMGEIVEIDSVGTVSQGVVTYNVKISFDGDDERVKPGMSVSATIITNMIQDVLIVPNSVVKSQKDMIYAEIFDSSSSGVPLKSQGYISDNLPKQVKITTGLIDDINTEITSGLKEGDIVVVKTILSTTKTTTPAPSIFSSMKGATKSNTSGNKEGGAVFPHN